MPPPDLARPGTYQSPQYGPPPGAGYGQGPGQYEPPPGMGYGQPGTGYGLPRYAQTPESNTSGMGAGYAEPPEASGWTFAGCVPWGLFAFVNGSTMWGWIALCSLIPYLGIVPKLIYFFYIGANGRKLAWQGRRFDSIEQYEQTMRAWNTAGVVLFAIIAAIFVLAFIIGLVGGITGAFD